MSSSVRLLMHRFFIASFAAGFLSISFAATACSCARTSVDLDTYLANVLQSSAIVVVAKPLKVTTDSKMRRKTAIVEIVEIIKGSLPVAEIYTQITGASCGVEFQLGEKRLFILDSKGWAHLCSNSFSGDYVPNRLKFLATNPEELSRVIAAPPTAQAFPKRRPSEWTIAEGATSAPIILVATLSDPPSKFGRGTITVEHILKGEVPQPTVVSGIGVHSYDRNRLDVGSTYLMFLMPQKDGSLLLLMARWHRSTDGSRWEMAAEEISEIERILKVAGPRQDARP